MLQCFRALMDHYPTELVWITRGTAHILLPPSVRRFFNAWYTTLLNYWRGVQKLTNYSSNGVRWGTRPCIMNTQNSLIVNHHVSFPFRVANVLPLIHGIIKKNKKIILQYWLLLFITKAKHIRWHLLLLKSFVRLFDYFRGVFIIRIF